MYKITTTEFGVVIETADSNGVVWYVPQDESNTDYQAYLIWLEEQA